MDKSGLEVNTGEIFMLAIQASAFPSNVEDFIDTVESDNLKPIRRIATLDDSLYHDGCQTGKIDFVPVILPE